jgi:glutaminyl-tRNA synthetase
VKGTLHWVSAAHAVSAEVRLYDYLFTQPDPDNIPEGKEFTDILNPHSLQVLTDCQVEPGLAHTQPGDRFQFLRNGYFVTDLDSTPARPVFNRTAILRDSWAKIQHKND